MQDIWDIYRGSSTLLFPMREQWRHLGSRRDSLGCLESPSSDSAEELPLFGLSRDLQRTKNVSVALHTAPGGWWHHSYLQMDLSYLNAIEGKVSVDCLLCPAVIAFIMEACF